MFILKSECSRYVIVSFNMDTGRSATCDECTDLLTCVPAYPALGAFSSACFAGQKLQIEKKTSFSRSRIRQ